MSDKNPNSGDGGKQIRTGMTAEMARGVYAHDAHFNMTLYDGCFTFFVREPMDPKKETINVSSRVFMPIHKAKELAEMILKSIDTTENKLRGDNNSN